MLGNGETYYEFIYSVVVFDNSIMNVRYYFQKMSFYCLISDDVGVEVFYRGVVNVTSFCDLSRGYIWNIHCEIFWICWRIKYNYSWFRKNAYLDNGKTQIP